MTEKIKACPYCGGEDTKVARYTEYGKHAYVKCNNCDARGPEDCSIAGDDAILLWNAAANALEAKDAEIEQLRKERHTMCVDYERVEQERDEARRVAKLFHGGIKAIARYANDWIVILDTDTRTEPPTTPCG